MVQFVLELPGVFIDFASVSVSWKAHFSATTTLTTTPFASFKQRRKTNFPVQRKTNQVKRTQAATKAGAKLAEGRAPRSPVPQANPTVTVVTVTRRISGPRRRRKAGKKTYLISIQTVTNCP